MLKSGGRFFRQPSQNHRKPVRVLYGSNGTKNGSESKHLPGFVPLVQPWCLRSTNALEIAPLASFGCRLVCHRPLALGRGNKNDSPAAACTSALYKSPETHGTARLATSYCTRHTACSPARRPVAATSPLAADAPCRSPRDASRRKTLRCRRKTLIRSSPRTRRGRRRINNGSPPARP